MRRSAIPTTTRTSEPRPPRQRRLTRRRLAGLAAAAALLLPGLPAAADTTPPQQAQEEAPAYGAPDTTAAHYYEALLRHTRWTESVYDSAAGIYELRDMNFAVVLGNAVLLTHGEYDAELAGTSEDALREHTLATITHYAASNRLVDPQGTWGRQLFWESTFQSYFLAAGRLLWDELDATTQANLTTIAAEQARYTADLNFGRDPLSGGWNAHWPQGNHDGDTALEEAGVYTQALAPGLAWAPEDPDAGRWAAQLADWGRNAAGQPTADRNNPAVVAGKPISSNTTQNIWDTYLVENHGSFGPHYQSDIWRSGARNAIHFLLADQEIPEILLTQPNSAELWRTIEMVMSAQGEPLMPLVNDREFLYGRDVLPLAFQGQVLRNPHAARAEASLAAALTDYQMYPPVYRLTKFSGEPKYEPEARAEIAISYLLHVHAAESGAGPVVPTPEDELFAALAGVRDFGAEPGIVMQQSEAAWAGAVSRQGFVKFPWVPAHDSWLFHISGSSPFLYPTTGARVDERSVRTYTGPRDGFEGTSSLFRIGDGYAGQVTLPTGSAIYASSGAGSGDGTVHVRNLDMSGYNGLDGSRTYTTAEGEVTASLPVERPTDPADANAARVDELSFDAVSARYVRMQGVRGNPTYGYSMYAFHVFAPDAAADLAAGKPAAASSEDTGNGRQAGRVTDGNPTTRWAVAPAERTRGDSWVQVDLGAATQVGAVRLAWESAAGQEYLVQTSLDGETWTTVERYGNAPEDANVARLDDVGLARADGEAGPVTARYVRMQGVRGNPDYGYSLYHFRVFGPGGGANLAAGRPATASSNDEGRSPGFVTDGNASTRWAVSRADRTRGDSWIQVDLGEARDVAHAQLGWESAAGQEYLVQTSLDGVTWETVGRHRERGDEILESAGGWINVEDTGGFVVRGAEAPITVARSGDTRHTIRLADDGGGALVEMVVGDAAVTAATAGRAVATADDEAVLVSDLDGYVSLFNLSPDAMTTTVTVPHDGAEVALYAGSQTVGASSSELEVEVPAGSAVVLAPRFVVSAGDGEGGLAGLAASVPDGRSIELTAPEGAAAAVDVRNVATGETRAVVVGADAAEDTARLLFLDAAPYPVPDYALSTLTFPASVLPAGMTSPSLAVDGDPSTSWVPGPGGRMVTDLGAARDIGTVIATWDGAAAPGLTVSTSDDGLTFEDVAEVAAGEQVGSVAVDRTARYVAVTTAWTPGDAGLRSLQVLAPGAANPELPPGLEVSVVADTRCVVGRVVETARVTNESDQPVEAVITSPYGSKTVTLGADRSTSVAFTTRLGSVPAGEVTVSSTADGLPGTTTVTAAYGARTCG
ncbi:discoidin domain-containing protein [Georgenia wangjunii]|uniref:discoidin domain-containing protein n=1 Tax=Georgenia wangjunii TaxID=3117730 RepID=UPI002F265098